VDESTTESPVLKALRRQIKDLEQELKARPAEQEVESRLRAQLKREADAAALLTGLGHSSGLAEFMLQKIGDAEITADAVSGFLQGIGLTADSASSEGEQPPSQNQQLADVTTLAGRVSAAASNTPTGDLAARIAAAQTQEQVNALMEEAGLVQSMF
jgi:hypothetical protein